MNNKETKSELNYPLSMVKNGREEYPNSRKHIPSNYIFKRGNKNNNKTMENGGEKELMHSFTGSNPL